jgi:hypothetical protein
MKHVELATSLKFVFLHVFQLLYLYFRLSHRGSDVMHVPMCADLLEHLREEQKL